MKYILLFWCVLLFQEDVPFKSSDEFQVDIHLSFKERPSDYNSNTYSSGGERMDRTKGQQTFLSILISKLKIREDEIRIAVTDLSGREIQKKKTDHLSEIKFDMGFVEDLKEKGSGAFVVYFISPEKKRLRKIVLTILPNGTFQVNGQWHGQF